MTDHDVHKVGFALSARNWFANKGDDTLRLDYPLTAESVVFDIGGYKGEFCEAIFSRYGCNVYCFEPVVSFYNVIKHKFSHNTKVSVFNFGLSSVDTDMLMSISENASSVYKNTGEDSVYIKLKSINNFIKEKNIDFIDLLKINIEGGEFDLIPSLIESGLICKINHIQVQFHDFVDDAIFKRLLIKRELSKTHKVDWEYYFIWESWSRV